MIGYLEAENAYKAAMTAHTEALEEKVYGEIIGRIKQDDSTVPYRLRGHWYYTRYETGQEYPVYARKAGTLDAPEQVMLDVNRMAEGHGFFQVGSTAIAPDNNLLAFTEDPVGRRQYTLRFKNLATGELLPDRIENVDPHIAWTADSRSILYLEKDPETLLARRVRRHVLGTDPGTGRARLRAGRRELLHERRHHQGRAFHHDLRAQHGVHRVALRGRGGPRARRFACSCRASATSSTTPTTSTGAGSSAPTGRRRTTA